MCDGEPHGCGPCLDPKNGRSISSPAPGHQRGSGRNRGQSSDGAAAGHLAPVKPLGRKYVRVGEVVMRLVFMKAGTLARGPVAKICGMDQPENQPSDQVGAGLFL